MKQRVHAFDWLRIIAFGLLILFHAGQPYNPHYTWHVSDSDKSDLLWTMLGWMRHWRLHLLFFISGFGTYFALRKVSDWTFLKERLTRLGLPLLFGIAVVVPPQMWVDRVTHRQYPDGFLTFYLQDYFTNGLNPEGNIWWSHLWFLPYLLLMTLLLSPLLIRLRNSGWLESRRFGELSMIRSVELLTRGALLPILPLGLLLVWPNRTLSLFDDWGWFAIWTMYFLLGFVVAGLRKEILPIIQRTRWVFLGLTAACYVVRYSNLLPLDGASEHILLRFLAWFAILALSGFALVHLNRDSAVKRYLNTAIFPIYVLHQTIMVVVAYWLLETGWAIGLKFMIIIISTLLGFGLMYEGIIKRLGPAGVLFGLKT